MTTDQERYDQLTREIAASRAEITRLTSALGVLEGAREDVAGKLAEAARTDDELIRWSTTKPGMQRLTAELTALHPAIVGFSQWKRTKRRDEDGHVWLMPELDMPFADKVDDRVEELAGALVEFAHRFAANPVPIDTHSSRIVWVTPQELAPGRVPVHVRAIGNTEARWTIEFDPETRVAMLTDGSTAYAKPYAGTLAQVLVQTSRHLFDLD